MEVAEFYKQHRAEILKIVAAENIGSITHANMKYEFTAMSGHHYYTYTGAMDMPLSRSARSTEYMDWLQNGLNPNDFERIANELTNCLAHINARTKEAPDKATTAGLLINEMLMRKKSATPYFVLINFIANNIVRDDENPNTWSSTIHAAKCDEIEAEMDVGNNAFFFALPLLRDFSRLQNMSPSELTIYLAKLQTEQVRLREVLNRIIDYKSETRSVS